MLKLLNMMFNSLLTIYFLSWILSVNNVLVILVITVHYLWFRLYFSDTHHKHPIEQGPGLIFCSSGLFYLPLFPHDNHPHHILDSITLPEGHNIFILVLLELTNTLAKLISKSHLATFLLSVHSSSSINTY